MKKMEKRKSIGQSIVLGMISIFLVVSMLGVKIGIVTATQENIEASIEPIATKIEQNIEKYFNLEENKVLLQQKVTIEVNKNEAKKENEKIQIVVPKIENKNPETINILANGNQIEENQFQYNEQTGQLNIQTNRKHKNL